MPNTVSLRIKNFNADRSAVFLKLKYEAMRADKYRFFRATTHIFYEDIPQRSFLRESPPVWLCGDLHLENFGSYKGDNRVAYFSINDFDECLLGPCLLDVVRMLTSVYMASHSLGIAHNGTQELSSLFANTYFKKLEEGYIRVLEKETTTGIIKRFLKEVQARKRKDFIEKRTEKKKSGLRLLIDNKHTAQLPDKEKEAVIAAIHAWMEHNPNPVFYEVQDVTYRIAGTSSLGLRRYVLLVKGKDGNYLLDMKEAVPSCVQKYIQTAQPKWNNEAQRVIEVQKRVLSDPPALLQSITMAGTNYVLKELQPTADRIDYTLFKGRQPKLDEILERMAGIYAWSNLRSAGRQGSAIADNLIAFAKEKTDVKSELMSYASAYAQKMNEYYEDYCKAYDKGFF